MNDFKTYYNMDSSGIRYKGDLKLTNKALESLNGCYTYIQGGFDCGDNALKNLIGGPETVSEYYGCYHNYGMESLEGGPKFVGGRFNCSQNPQMKNQVEQIFKYQIKADYYITDEGQFDFNTIKDKFEAYPKMKAVKSKGFRTLLGLDKNDI